MPVSQDNLLGFYRNGDLQQFLHGIFDNWDTIDIAFLEQLSKKIQEEETLLGVQKLILQDYHAEKSNHDRCQETIVDIVEFVKQANLSVRELRLSLHDLGHSRKKLYRYFSPEKAQEDEDKSQREVCERFFRTGKKLLAGKAAETLLKQILVNTQNVTVERSGQFANKWRGPAIQIDGYSARSLIIALVKAMSKRNDEKDRFPIVIFKIGNTEILYDSAPTDRQIGNAWVSVKNLASHFPYGSARGQIDEKLQSVVGIAGTHDCVARTQMLAGLMREKTRVLSTFKKEDFNQAGLIRLGSEPVFVIADRLTADIEIIIQNITHRIHYLNGLNFLRAVVEPARRLYRSAAPISESDAMPIAILQARSNRLLSVGALSVRDVYGDTVAADWKDGLTKDGRYSNPRHAKYGVATGEMTTVHVDIMEQKATAINEKIELVVTRSPDQISEYKDRLSLCEQVGFFQRVKAGRNYMRGELGDEYGSGSESDHSDYSSDGNHP